MSAMTHIICPACSKSCRIAAEPVPVTPFARWCESCLTHAIEQIGRLHDHLRYEESRRGQELLRQMMTDEFDSVAKYISAHW